MYSLVQLIEKLSQESWINTHEIGKF